MTQDQPIAELETDKVTLELAAPASGVLTEILAEAGSEVDARTLLGRISAPARGLITSPAVRKLLREHQLELNQIAGTGRGGRVTRKDVLTFLNASPGSGSAEPPETVVTSKSSKTSKSDDSSRIHKASKTEESLRGHLVPHSSMRRRIAENMVESLLHTAPHVTSVWQMDMTNVIAHRKWHKKEYQAQGVNLTYTAYFLSAAALALRAVPETNARFHEEGLELFDEVNIGVGTALGNDGLVVPVVHAIHTKTLFQIAQDLTDQTLRARQGQLKPSEMKGGTFTLSNHGVSGSLIAAPIIINQPQVAILGIGKLEKRVVVVEDKARGEDRMTIRPQCYISLTIDHRALDAHHTNQWLAVFTQAIEQWGQ